MNSPAWATRELFLNGLDAFRAIYEARPIRDNAGGMLSTHMFYTWLTAKTLNPELIIDSGTYKGQSAWLFKQACPNARIISFDIDTSQREITCEGIEYVDGDFSQYDWSDISDKSLAFFDDHQNAYNRMQQCNWFDIKNIMFEDNYPPQQGDCYSPKKIFSCAGFRDTRTSQGKNNTKKGSIARKIAQKLIRKLQGNEPRESQMEQFQAIRVNKNGWDKRILESKLENYIEFPPIYQCDFTRWGDAWDKNYPTPEPLKGYISSEEAINSADIYARECKAYTWICLCKLK